MWLLTALLMHINIYIIYIYINCCVNAVDYWRNFGFMKPWLCQTINRAVSGSSRTVTLNAFRPQSLYYCFFLFLFFIETCSKMLRKQMVHCWELIPKALFISLPEVWSLRCGASCLWNVLFINQGLKWPPVFKKYNKLLKVCFGSNYEENMFLQISDFRVDLLCLSACPTAVELSVILLSVLESSPLANVAHDISPVPVLNCELNGPETHSQGVLSSQEPRFSLENESKALNWSLKPLKTLQISAVWVRMAQWNDILKAGFVLFTISLTTSLKNLGKRKITP